MDRRLVGCLGMVGGGWVDSAPSKRVAVTAGWDWVAGVGAVVDGWELGAGGVGAELSSTRKAVSSALAVRGSTEQLMSPFQTGEVAGSVLDATTV